MKISTVTPLVQRGTGPRYGYDRRQFELALDSGEYVVVEAADVLRYRTVQRILLHETGCVFVYEPAEKRGGVAAWQAHVAELLTDQEEVPERDGSGAYVYSMARWRREHRDLQVLAS